MSFLIKSGWCPICEADVIFKSQNSWLRDNFKCSGCGSVPRERALMAVIDRYYPKYHDFVIHESSPAVRGVSEKLRKTCNLYSASHFYEDIPSGEKHHKHGIRCENLEKLSFTDNSFDLFITQDVMEHVFDSNAAFREIARVLKPGGAHIFTVPLVNKNQPSECWASLDSDDNIIYHKPAEYHGNPINSEGSLVTMHWGYDIAERIIEKSGLYSTIVMIDDLDQGIRAEYIEVLVSRKPPVSG